MRYLELINAIAIHAHMDTNVIEKVLAAYTAEVLKALRIGDVVNHKNHAVYYVGKRTARNGVNPRTQTPIRLKAKKIIRARFARGAVDSLN